MNTPGHSINAANYDQDWSLGDMLGVIDTAELLRCLQGVLEADFSIEDDQGKCLLGSSLDTSLPRKAISVELEDIGFLVASAEPKQLELAHSLFMSQLKIAQKYLMASTLHLAAVQEDFQNLQNQNEALEDSQRKYKLLNQQLEARVNQQVLKMQQANLQLYEAQRQSSVGQLAAGIAHEINNPIGFMASNLRTAKMYLNRLLNVAELLNERTVDDELNEAWHENNTPHMLEDFQELLDDCLEGSDRIARIVADLRLFSNLDAEESSYTALDSLLRSTADIAKIQAEGHKGVNLQLQEVPPVLCKPGYIGQALLALLMNAFEAVSESGEVTIALTQADETVRISIRDNGPGISSIDLPKIFDPFFTTKEIGAGMGLGLTVCRDIARAHGGEIEVHTSPSGTEMCLWLPLNARLNETKT